MAQMWIQEFQLKKRKSLGLFAPVTDQGKSGGGEIARFNVAYMLIHSEDADQIELESRTLIQKLKDKDPKSRQSLLVMEQPLPELPEEEQSDWKIIVDLRAAHNLPSGPVAIDVDDP